MNITERLKLAYTAFSSQKLSTPTEDNNEFWFAMFGLTKPGQIKYYDQDPSVYIDKGYMINPHIYAVINKVIKPLSLLPFGVFEVKDESRLKSALMHEKSGNFIETRLAKAHALAPFENEITNRFFTNPNECQGWTEFVQEATGSKLLTGNHFMYGLNPVGMDGVFTKAYNLPSQFVEIITGEWTQPISGYKLIMNSNIIFKPESIMHRKYYNPKKSVDGGFFAGNVRVVDGLLDGSSMGGGGSNYYGMSPMAPLLKVVKRSNDSYTANLKMLENGIPAGIISGQNDGEPFSDTERKRLAKEYKKKFGGAKNKNEILFASAQLKWQSMGLNSVDMQLLKSDSIDLETIARVYQVPLPLLIQTAQAFNNYLTAQQSLWWDAIIPEANDFRDELNAFMLPGWEEMTGKKLFIDYDLSGVQPLQKDMEKLTKRLILERESGLLTGNEYNIAIGREVSTDPNMDKRVMRTNLQFQDTKKEGNDTD